MKKLGIATALVSLTAVAAPGLAAAGSDDVRSNGKCSGSSTSKIKAKARDGRLEVEFEVDQNKNGVPWKVKIKDNGDVQFRGTATTKAPSGFVLDREADRRSGGHRLDQGHRAQQGHRRALRRRAEDLTASGWRG